MYMFVREDLTTAQQIVQTAHAVDDVNKQCPHAPGNYMVLCGANDEQELMAIAQQLIEERIEHVMFYEPDVNGFTAIATEPLRGNRRKPMQRYRLKK
jgi:hypothetical protein